MLTLLQATPAPPAPPGLPVARPQGIGFGAQDAAVDAASLRGQIRDLRVELSGLQAQWDGLYSQLNVMLKNNPARPGVQQSWADVGVQIARVKGEIAYREARLSQVGGGGNATTTVPGGGAPGGPPPVPVVAGAVLLMVLGLPVSIAWARRILRGQSRPAPVPVDHTTRLENIEQAIDAVAIEVERIAEGQRFVTKILAQRPERVSAVESSLEPLSASPPSAPKALGAGPIEPIGVPHREQVRQRIITPH